MKIKYVLGFVLLISFMVFITTSAGLGFALYVAKNPKDVPGKLKMENLEVKAEGLSKRDEWFQKNDLRAVQLMADFHSLNGTLPPVSREDVKKVHDFVLAKHKRSDLVIVSSDDVSYRARFTFNGRYFSISTIEETPFTSYNYISYSVKPDEDIDFRNMLTFTDTGLDGYVDMAFQDAAQGGDRRFLHVEQFTPEGREPKHKGAEYVDYWQNEYAVAIKATIDYYGL